MQAWGREICEDIGAPLLLNVACQNRSSRALRHVCIDTRLLHELMAAVPLTAGPSTSSFDQGLKGGERIVEVNGTPVGKPRLGA